MGEVLGPIGSIIGSIISNNAANARFNKMMAHVREIEAYQKHLLASGVNSLTGGRQAWEQDPNRAKVKAAWNSYLDNPSAMTPEFQSQLKATALSGSAKQAADASRSLDRSAQQHGLGNSPYAATLKAGLYRGASQDALNLSTSIDTEAEQRRFSDKTKALGEYTSWQSGDAAQEYSFSKDMANLLGSVNFGNSLALPGG